MLKLTLVQAMRHESLVSGLAQVTISGMKGDEPARFTVGELLGQPRAQLPFSFRYFQTIEQAVTLPEGFQPFEAYVQVQFQQDLARRCSRHSRGKWAMRLRFEAPARRG